MSEVKLAAEPRTEFGKGAARRLRRDHKVPAVLYGHGTDPVHIALPGHDTMMALKVSNALLSLDLEGKPTLALPKDVQRDPLRGTIEHVDLLIVRRGEKVAVDVALHIVGTPAIGTMVISDLTTLNIEVEATSIPSFIELDITGLEAGSQVHASDVPLPAGSTLLTDAEALVAAVNDATVASDTGDEAGTGSTEGAEAGAADAE